MWTCACGATKFRLLLLQATYDGREWQWNIPMKCFNDDCDAVHLFVVSPTEYASLLSKRVYGEDCVVKSHEEGS